MDKIFRGLLKYSNFIIAILFTVVGTAVILYGAYDSFKSFKFILTKAESEEKVISEVLKGVDLIFLGIVIQLLGVGLYELFVQSISGLPEWLVIKDFDQLKVLIVKAAITVITISFVGRTVTWDGSENILYYGVGIGAIIAALSYFIKVKT